MSHPTPEELGPPSIRLRFLQIWVYGRQFPDSQDDWDGNWLNVAVHCGFQGGSVWAKGAILDAVALSTFRKGLNGINTTLVGEAVLESVEPNIRARVSPSDGAGHLRVRVEITPNNLDQGHWFEFEADQSYLPALIAELDSVLRQFPVRGSTRRGGLNRDLA